MTPWEIQGRELINCNCAWGCPCQFNALPTNGFCEAVGVVAIDKGRYGDVTLDGTICAMVVHWPGPIHEGKGKCQPIVDERAGAAQRDAILRIMAGQDTDPFATFFAVFATTFDEVFEPIFAPIELELDVAERRGSVRVAGVLEIEGGPIRNPVTGEVHRARIELPHGFEYEVAEIGSGTSRSRGKIAVDLKGTHAQFASLHMNNHGVIRHRAVA
jgi:hypothetical protein